MNNPQLHPVWTNFWDMAFIDLKQTFPHIKCFIEIQHTITDEEYDFVEDNMNGRFTSKPDILGGCMVFTIERYRPTRLSVLHVGQMLFKGEKESAILEDYPYLIPNCLVFAQWYRRIIYALAGL